METQLRLKQIMLAASLILSGALHAMDPMDPMAQENAGNLLNPTPAVEMMPVLTQPVPVLTQPEGKVDALFPKLVEKITHAVTEESVDATGAVAEETIETAATTWSDRFGYVWSETKRLKKAFDENIYDPYLSAEATRQKYAEQVERAEQLEVMRQLQEAEAARLAAAEAAKLAEQQEVLRQLNEEAAKNSYVNRIYNNAVSMKDSALNNASSLKDSALNNASSLKDSALNRAASLKDSVVQYGSVALNATQNGLTTAKDAIVANPGTTAAAVAATAAVLGGTWYVYKNDLLPVNVLSNRARYTAVEYSTFVEKLGNQDIVELEKGDKAKATSAISTLKVPRVDGPLKTLIEEIKTELNDLYVAKNVNDYNTVLADALNRLEEAAKPKPVAQDVPATTTTVTAQARAAVNAVWGYFTPKQTTPSIAQMNKALEQSLAVLDNNTQGTANVIVNRVTVEIDGESSKTTATTPSTTQVINQGSNVADQAVVAKPVSVNTQTATVTKRPTISFQSVRAIRPTSQFKALEIANIDADYIMQSIDNQRVLIALIFTNCTFNNSAEDYKKANKTLEEILNNAIADAQDVTRQQELQTLKTACGAAYKADLAALKAYNTTK